MSNDPHRAAAAILFNVPEDQVTPEQRARAKTINYATIYGRAASRDTDGVTPRRWLSEVPDLCEFCGQPWNDGVFYDAAIFVTPMGAPDRRMWGLCCHTCFTDGNGKLGTGKGQKYDLLTRVKLNG